MTSYTNVAVARSPWFYDHLPMSVAEAVIYTGFPRQMLMDALHDSHVRRAEICPFVLDLVMRTPRWQKLRERLTLANRNPTLDSTP